MRRVLQLTGAGAVVAGVSWAVAAVLHSMQPEGCVGQACLTGGPMRGSTPTTDVVFVLAGIMLAASVAGVLVLARRAGAGRATWVAGVACALGIGLFLAAGSVSTFGDPDWDGMPLLVGPGIMLVVLGLVVLAVVVWRSRVLPRGLVVAVLLTALLLPLANEQTRLVLLAVPFGLAWAAAGAWLLASGGRAASSRTAPSGPRATGAEPHTSTQTAHR